MRIYHRPGAGRPVRALWALEEAGLPYELETVSAEGESAERHRALGEYAGIVRSSMTEHGHHAAGALVID